jgi:hypothetical protein
MNFVKDRVMQFLFDSNGKHIANWVDEQLYAPKGQNIGHWRAPEKIFIDMEGQYLGEVFNKDRLVRYRQSPWVRLNFGRYGNYGNIGNFGSPGQSGTIVLPIGFEDVSDLSV